MKKMEPMGKKTDGYNDATLLSAQRLADLLGLDKTRLVPERDGDTAWDVTVNPPVRYMRVLTDYHKSEYGWQETPQRQWCWVDGLIEQMCRAYEKKWLHDQVMCHLADIGAIRQVTNER